MSKGFQLRDYQTEAVEAVLHHFRESLEPVVVVLPTGAGKSLVIAELGRKAQGKVLVLAHVKELVEQNHAKYEAWGLVGDIFAAGLKRKESQGKVVFGSVQSVARNLDRFDQSYSLLIIDECHRVAEDSDSQYQQVLRHLLTTNPKLCILGLTATPYRMGTGWIYSYHHLGKVRTKEHKLFYSCVYELPLRTLIQRGYLTPARVVDVLAAQYDFQSLKPSPSGRYTEADMNRVIQGDRRVTPQIIEQVIELSHDRKGVMLFASTVAHAKEIVSYLPNEQTALIIGETASQERDKTIQAFKNQDIKYLVNVSVLTTGFDAPHVDMIAILRPTESISLYQQIVGRGLRLAPDKQDCLVLDYACNGYDLYSPEVGSPRPNPNTEPVEVVCPQCGFTNTFWGKLDREGRLMEHYGRKCQGFAEVDGDKKFCDFRFRFKECGNCGAENDIAARQCNQCKQVLVDPDKKLRDALQGKNSKVLRCSWMDLTIHHKANNEPSLKITYYDEDGSELEEYYRMDTAAQRGAFFHRFVRLHYKLPGQPFWVKDVEQVLAVKDRFRRPDFVIARKDGRFWKIHQKIFDYKGPYRKADDAG